MKVFDLQTKKVKASEKGKPIEEVSYPLLALAIALIGTFQSVLASTVLSLVMLSEEREKNTFETTSTLPLSTWSILGGKFLAASAGALCSATIYALALTVCVLILLEQSGGVINRLLRTSHSFHITFVDDFWSIAFAFAAVGFATALANSLLMACIASCRTFKAAQAITTYPSIILTFLPCIGLIPGIEQNWWAYLIPVADIVMVLKHIHNESHQLVGWAITSLWTLALFFSAGTQFFSERTLLGGGSQLRRAHQQIEEV